VCLFAGFFKFFHYTYDALRRGTNLSSCISHLLKPLGNNRYVSGLNGKCCSVDSRLFSSLPDVLDVVCSFEMPENPTYFILCKNPKAAIIRSIVLISLKCNKLMSLGCLCTLFTIRLSPILPNKNFFPNSR
jgi:hypothetical protein